MKIVLFVVIMAYVSSERMQNLLLCHSCGAHYNTCQPSVIEPVTWKLFQVLNRCMREYEDCVTNFCEKNLNNQRKMLQIKRMFHSKIKNIQLSI